MEKILYDYYNNFAVQLYKGNVKSAEQYQNMEKDLENMNTDVSKQFIVLCKKYLMVNNPSTLNLNMKDIISISNELGTFCSQADKNDVSLKYLSNKIFKK